MSAHGAAPAACLQCACAAAADGAAWAGWQPSVCSAAAAHQCAPCTPLPPPLPAACGAPLYSTNLLGGDLPDGVVAGKTAADCCRACQLKGPRCHGWTFVAAWQKCYLKAAGGWQVKPNLLMQSWVAPPPPSECTSWRAGCCPEPRLRRLQGQPSRCALVQSPHLSCWLLLAGKVCNSQLLNNTDLYGADLPAGKVAAASHEVCCAACNQRPDCRSWTWSPKDKIVSGASGGHWWGFVGRGDGQARDGRLHTALPPHLPPPTAQLCASTPCLHRLQCYLKRADGWTRKTIKGLVSWRAPPPPTPERQRSERPVRQPSCSLCLPGRLRPGPAVWRLRQYGQAARGGA